ncbi:MAG: hypothetical protein IJP03_05690, partial [Christensenellaceae bacterium]|nr:hypothetical protein [Christensenellaceae bacterium]
EEIMDLNGIDMNALVELIRKEVMGRIKYEGVSDERVEGTVALFTSFVPSKKACGAVLKEHFGEGIDCAMFGDLEFQVPGCFQFKVENREDQSELMQKLAGTADVVLVTPKLSTLYTLAEGNDDDFVAQAVLRPLLWGRRVSILLDFDPPKFRRATFFEKVVDALDILTGMGVRILSYRPAAEYGEVERKSLVTETDVRDALDDGSKRILCASDAIITPLAREKAAELGVALDF